MHKHKRTRNFFWPHVIKLMRGRKTFLSFYVRTSFRGFHFILFFALFLAAKSLFRFSWLPSPPPLLPPPSPPPPPPFSQLPAKDRRRQRRKKKERKKKTSSRRNKVKKICGCSGRKCGSLSKERKKEGNKKKLEGKKRGKNLIKKNLLRSFVRKHV